MKLEQQVCTLEQAKRLKELGVTVDSYFAMEADGTARPTRDYLYFEKGLEDTYPAYTASELGAMLPDYTPELGNLEVSKGETDHVSLKKHKNPWWNASYWTWDYKNGEMKQVSKHLHQEPTLAQTLAALLIHLLSTHLITAASCNEVGK